jgi:hypothetical protein
MKIVKAMNTLAHQIIRIPEALMRFPVTACRFRRRTLNALARYRLLGELQGLGYARLFNLATPEGARSALAMAHRLDALAQETAERKSAWARMLAGGRGSRPAADAVSVGGPQPDPLDWLLLGELLQSVPARFDDLEVRLIPHAACINAFLSSNGIATIRQLKAFDFIQSNWGLGRMKLNSLIELVRRAQDDSLQTGVANESEAARLIIKTVDAFMKLPGKEDVNRMLRLRMSGATADDKPWTLEHIGRTFKLTRERIRQIIDENQLPGLANFGGMRLHKALLCLGDFCEAPTRPVTETRLAKWLGSTSRDYPLSFYLALAEALAPADTLPVWVETPFYNYGNNQRVIQARRRLATLRLEPGKPLAFDAVFDQLRRKLPSLNRKIFLAALFQNPAFEVDPDAGTLVRQPAS